MADALLLLRSAQNALRSRFDDFRNALERRDEEASRMALVDFHRCLCRWTEAEEKALLPALRRVDLRDRDPQRELHLQWVQIRELTRFLLLRITEHGPLADILGFTQNLERRFAAHESEMDAVYYPAAAPVLSLEERKALEDAAPGP